MNYPAKSKSGKQLEKMRSGRNAMFCCAALIGGSTLLKSQDIFATGFIPNWASWILVAALLCAAIVTSIKITAQESL